MNFIDLLTGHHLAKLNDWLLESGELYVYICWPHSGGSGAPWFVNRLDALKTLIAQQDWPEIAIMIYRQVQYPIRGLADEAMLERALQEIPDGAEFSIYRLDELYSDYTNSGGVGGGDTHIELRSELSDLFGTEVALGVDPEVHDLKWIYSHPNEVMYFAVTMNQKYYEPFARDPSRYDGVV
jgi:hypothetical protein